MTVQLYQKMKTLKRLLLEFRNLIKTWRKKFLGWYYFRDSSIRIHGRIKLLRRNRIQIGHSCALNEGVMIDPGSGLKIGSNVVISANTMILGSDLDPGSPTRHHAGRIFIDDNVWIGAGSIILKNIHIGKGAVIGAGSVVTKDVSPNVVVAGNPARIIRER